MTVETNAAEPEPTGFAVLQLSGCSGCEMSLLASDRAALESLRYLPLLSSVHTMPEVDLLLVTGGVRTDEDRFNLRRAVRRARRVAAIGTCAISGGVASLGNRDEVRRFFLEQEGRRHVPQLLPRCGPIDEHVEVDLYLPGCPPTPELLEAVILGPTDHRLPRTVCKECDRTKDRSVRPTSLRGFRHGEVDPELCLISQGFLCIGSSTRGGCRAPCPIAGHPCVGCRGPSDSFVDKQSGEWFERIERVFGSLTDIPTEEIDAALRAPHMALFLFQFTDQTEGPDSPRDKVL